jgi:hypothetical protein
VVGIGDAAVALERGAGASRFVVAVNPGETATALHLRFDDAPGGAGGHVAPVWLPGFEGVREANIVDGGATIEMAARSGAVLSVRISVILRVLW